MSARSTARRSLFLILALLLGSLSQGSTCQAGLVLQLSTNVTATAGSTGSFEVLLVNTDPIGSPDYHIATDFVTLALQNIAGVTFTSATIAPTNPADSPYTYIYSQTGTTPTDPLSFDAFPNTSFTASDSQFAPPPPGSTFSYRSVAAGAVYRLVYVTYAVAASAAPGVGQISFEDVGGGTSLSDENFAPVDFTVQNGTFTIASVPGPGSLALSLISLGAGGLARLGRRGDRRAR